MSGGASSIELIASIATGVADAMEFTPSRVGGRLHPLLIHFPIALVFAAAAAEGWRAVRREPGLSPASPPLLVAAAVTAALAAGSGWLNAAWEYANDTTDSLFWHRWLGTGSAVLLVLVASIAWRSRRAETLASMHVARRLGAIVAALVVAVVGHFGGEIVRGEGYVIEAFRSGARDALDMGDAGRATDTALVVTDAPPVDPEKQAFFLASVRPLLDAHCIECHGARKQKGGLRLTPISAAFAGELDNWPIVPGRPESSELMDRVQLPADDPDAMPARGERLTSAEIAALRQWIADGAVVPTSERVGAISQSAFAPSPSPSRGFQRAVEQIAERGAIVQPIFAGSPLYELNASLVSPIWTDADMARIDGLSAALADVNLARSAITDEAIVRLAAMPELVQLRVDRTAITDRAVAAFLLMPKLETLNLVGTAVTDVGLVQLASHRALKRVYVWESKVTSAGALRAKELRPELDIVGAPAAAPDPATATAP